MQFGDGFTTGSSMMPQKRNPDALEIARSSAARMLGDLTALLATLKGLPSSYNKDLQDDKRVLFDAVDTISLVLPAVTRARWPSCQFDAARMKERVSSAMMATDLADYLVREGRHVPRGARGRGQPRPTVRGAGSELHTLPRTVFAAAHAAFGDDVYEALSPRRSLERREVEGGTGPNAVKQQLELARASLLPMPEIRGNELSVLVG